MNLSEKKLIIFDFDGTIADTVDIFVKTNNKNFKEYGTKFVSHEDTKKLKKLDDLAVLKFLDINIIEFFLISKRFLRDISKYMHEAPIYEGMLNLLKELNFAKKHISIVSRNSVKNIKKCLNFQNIEFIRQIYAESLFKRKHHLIKSLLKKYQLDAADTVFIGDRISDFRAAQKANVDFIFVTWGYGTATEEIKKELQYTAHKVIDLKEMLLQNAKK